MIKQLSILYRTFFNTRRIINFFPGRDKHRVDIPEHDSFLRDQEVQWWYWTGHLNTPDGRRFGYELVFFGFASWIIFKDVLAQAAITDSEGKKFYFRGHMDFMTLPRKIPDRFNLKMKDNGHTVMHAIGGDGQDTLEFNIDGIKVKLNLDASKKPVIHYNSMAHQYIYGGYTYYYSREQMFTRGSITIDGQEFPVSGVSWFDRQYGDLFQSIFKGWQWFAMNFDDGRTVMLYDFTRKYEAQESFGSVTISEQTHHLGPFDFTVRILKTWQSPHTDTLYPVEWQIEIDNKVYIVQPVIEDQELRAEDEVWIGPEYWEGDCVILENGTAAGSAYVELNGFGNKLFSLENGMGL